MSFGLSESDMDYMVATLQSFLEVKKAMIFGSRAMGNFKRGSDVDIALFGKDVDFSIVAKIKDRLQEESPMPYMFDIVDATHTNSDALKGHIEEYGVVLFSRNKNDIK